MAGPAPHGRARHRRRRPRRRLIATGVGAAVLLAAVVFGVLALVGNKPSASDRTGTTTTTTTLPAATSTANPPKHSTSTTAPTTTTPTTTTTLPASTTTTAPVNLVSPSSVLVQIVNGFGGRGAAASAASALRTAGFVINGTGDADSFDTTESVIQYGPGELSAAETLNSHIEGSVQLQEVSDLPASNELVLVLGSTYRGVAA